VLGGKAGGLATAAQDEGGQEQAKTLKEILDEREEQIKDIEQLEGKLVLFTFNNFRSQADQLHSEASGRYPRRRWRRTLV
jgi:archaellum component FlaC